jgi:hypothetical protein
VAGATNDSTLCFQADWLRMRLLKGELLDQIGVAKDFMDMMAAAVNQEPAGFLSGLREALNDTAQLAKERKPDEAKQRAREFLAPFLSPDRPRLRHRLPWSFAQANEELTSLPPLFRSVLGLTDERVAALRPPMAELAVELAEKIHPGDKLSIELVRKARERVVHGNFKNDGEGFRVFSQDADR